MREVIEHFGIGFLELTGGIGIVNIIVMFFGKNGLIKDVILEYFCGLCG